MRILFVAARFPYPALLGYQVRALHQLRLLSRRHRITLLSFTVGALRDADRRVVAELCDETVTVPLRRLDMVRALVRGATSDRPLQASLFETAPMREALRALLAEGRHDLLHLQLARMAGHLDDVAAPIPRVVDLIDALSLNMERRHTHDTGPMRWAARLETGRLARYERVLCNAWDRALVVSETDRAAIGDFPNLVVNSNGVDVGRFRPLAVHDPHRVVFTGNLGYFPNVDALRWFVEAVLPPLWRALPAVRFAVVGARPSRAVRRLARRDSRINIEGRVDDLHAALARSAVAVAPMRAGSGQKLKVLEAMASAVPVVATTRAASGIDAEPGRHLLIADAADDFTAAVVRVLREPALAASLATAGRQLVEQRYTWERSVADLDALYDELVEPAEHEVLQHAS